MTCHNLQCHNVTIHKVTIYNLNQVLSDEMYTSYYSELAQPCCVLPKLNSILNGWKLIKVSNIGYTSSASWEMCLSQTFTFRCSYQLWKKPASAAAGQTPLKRMWNSWSTTISQGRFVFSDLEFSKLQGYNFLGKILHNPKERVWITYRVFFFTRPPPKMSKYGKS